MTMFTQGRLQAYERMMQQTSRHDRENNGDDKVAVNKRFTDSRAMKGGNRNGSNSSKEK